MEANKYKILWTMSILSLILVACASVNAVTHTQDIPNLKKPVATEVAGLPDKTKEVYPVIAATEISHTAMAELTETVQVNQVDQLLASYLAGEKVDTSILSQTEFAQFSAKLAEIRNAERDINPIIYNNEAFLNPNNLNMRDYDGHPDLEETVEMYLAIKGKDSVGNLQIVDLDGKIVTIKNSADVTWGKAGRVTDPFDTRINWPTVGKVDGMVDIQWYISSDSKDPCTIIPAIFMKKELGSIYLEDDTGGRFASFLQFLAIETDSAGKPILARKFLVVSSGNLKYFEEGLSVTSGMNGFQTQDYSSFYKNLEENTVYFLLASLDQNTIYERTMGSKPNNYKGLAWGEEASSILFEDNLTKNNDMILLPSRAMMKHK